MMMRKEIALIVTLFVAGILGNLTPKVPIGSVQVNSSTGNGFDVILLDTPSWATSIQRSWTTEEFYVYGGNTVRTIHSGNTTDFYAEVIPQAGQTPPYLGLKLNDVHTFLPNNSKIEWTFGIAPFDVAQKAQFTNSGPYLALATIATTVGSQSNPAINIQDMITVGGADFTGFLFNALRCDEWTLRNQSEVITYLTAFVVDTTPNATNGVSFALIRTYYQLPPAQGGIVTPSTFDFDEQSDVAVLYTNQFTSFSSTYKPWIHLIYDFTNNRTSMAVVVDPNTKMVYGVDVTGDLDAKPNTFVDLSDEAGYEMVSCAYDPFSQAMVVGFAAEGFQPGLLFLFDFSKSVSVIPDPLQIELPTNYSNPKALAIDFDRFNASNRNIYMGMNGFNEVLRYNYILKVFGYQRLPEYLHRSWDATVTHGHVYFVSNEQNSKVYRVSKEDFCPATCPYFGFCKGGKCACADGFELSHDKKTCEFKVAEEKIKYVHKYHTAHGGEIALGILFTLSFLAAAGGWFMWYRGGRRGAYQAV